MAIVHASIGINFDYSPVSNGTIIAATATRFALQEGDSIVEYTGRGFAYSDVGISGGTLTGYAEYYKGVLMKNIYNASVPAAWAYQHLQADDFNSVLAEALNGNDIIVGSSYNDKIFGYGGNDYIFGSGGWDTIDAGDGNDIIDAGYGSNTIDGGNGIDTVVLASDRASYQLNRNEHNITVVHNLGHSTDATVNVERFQFTDGTLAFDTDGHSGQAFRLYQAAFDRVPDYSGLGYWIGTLDDGTGLTNVAARFIDSDEFKAIYGHDVSNEQFVDKLYWNILNRDGDEGGRAYWTEELNAGYRSRADVLVGFSESDENVVGVAPSINDGIWFV